MEPIEFEEEELSEETTSDSVYSETEEDNSDDDERDSSDKETVTMQALLHGSNQDSEESSSDEWDPSKNNPTKKRKKKTVNKKMKKKKHSLLEKSKGENTQETSGLGLLNELLFDDSNDSDNSWSPYTEKKEDSLKAKEKSKLKKKLTKFKQKGDKVEGDQTDTSLTVFNTDENQTIGAKAIEPNGVSLCSNKAVDSNSQNIIMQANNSSVSPKKNRKSKQSPSELNLSNERTENSSKKNIPVKSAQPMVNTVMQVCATKKIQLLKFNFESLKHNFKVQLNLFLVFVLNSLPYNFTHFCENVFNIGLTNIFCFILL